VAAQRTAPPCLHHSAAAAHALALFLRCALKAKFRHRRAHSMQINIAAP